MRIARVSLATSRYCLEVSRMFFLCDVGVRRFKDMLFTIVFSKMLHQRPVCSGTIHTLLLQGKQDSFIPSLKAGVSATPAPQRCYESPFWKSVSLVWPNRIVIYFEALLLYVILISLLEHSTSRINPAFASRSMNAGFFGG